VAPKRFWVFDLDDTLYAEADYVHSALNWAGARVTRIFGIPDAQGQLVALQAKGMADPIAAFWQGAKLPEAAREQIVAGMRAHVPEIVLRPGAKAVLDALRASGVGFGIMTDGRSVTQRAKIAALGCTDARAILISGESGWQKPDPRCYGFFAQHIPGGAFGYVGDNPKKDFVGAKAAGWRTIMLQDDGRHIHGQGDVADAAFQADEAAANWAGISALICG
jgi:putative hydrolase of the HAD superfamily